MRYERRTHCRPGTIHRDIERANSQNTYTPHRPGRQSDRKRWLERMGSVEGFLVCAAMIVTALLTRSTETALAIGIMALAFMMKGDNDRRTDVE